MNKLALIKKYLSGVNYAYAAVLALLLKAIISDVSYPAFLITAPILGFEAYKLYIKSKQPDPVVINAEIRRELDNLKAKIQADSLEKTLTKPNIRYF